MKYISINKYKKILFLGDSITQSAQYVNYIDTYLTTHFYDIKPQIINLGLSSETAAGLSEANHPFPRPCIHQRIEKVLSCIKPDLVVSCYGMNDGIYHPFSEERFSAYQRGIMKLVDQVKQAGADIICITPPPFDIEMIDKSLVQELGAVDYGFMAPYKDYNKVLERYSVWLMKEGMGEGTVDIFNSTLNDIKNKRIENPLYHSGDGIHVNNRGHFIFAKTILKEIFNLSLERMPCYVDHSEKSVIYQLIERKNRLISHTLLEHIGHGNKLLQLEPLGFEELEEQVKNIEKEIQKNLFKEIQKIDVGEFKGYKSYQFYVEGRECILVEPKQSNSKRYWVWRAEFFDAFSYVDMALLEQGWHIAYCNVSDMYGAKEAIDIMNKFYEYIIRQFSLNPCVDSFGFSRGGLYATQYASQYPEHIRTIYLDAPVINPCSWPGGMYKGIGSQKEWKDCLKIYKIEEQEAVRKFEDIRKDITKKLVEANIPLIVVAGDKDEIVPYEENGELLVKAYKEKRRTIKVIIKQGVGHHPHSLEEPKDIVEFIKISEG